jgi:hypothetical protein
MTPKRNSILSASASLRNGLVLGTKNVAKSVRRKGFGYVKPASNTDPLDNIE